MFIRSRFFMSNLICRKNLKSNIKLNMMLNDLFMLFQCQTMDYKQACSSSPTVLEVPAWLPQGLTHQINVHIDQPDTDMQYNTIILIHPATNRSDNTTTGNFKLFCSDISFTVLQLHLKYRYQLNSVKFICCNMFNFGYFLYLN